MAIRTDAGADVSYLLLTSGEAGIDSIDPAECRAVRAAEQRRACARVGVDDLRILDYPDGMLEYSLALRREVATVVRDVRPTTVITLGWGMEMPWGLNQADHRVAGTVALDAARDAGNRWIFRDITDDNCDVLEPWQTGQLLVFNSSGETHAVAVTARAVERSIASLEEHEAYLAALADHPAPRDLIEGVTSDAGARAGVDHAVAFHRYEL